MTEITPLIDLLIRLPAYSLLMYVPFVCYFDLKYRSVPLPLWLPLWLLNVPVVAYLYLTGIYSSVTLPLSLIICAFLYLVMRVSQYEYLNGDDLLYLWAICVFLIINPFPVPHGVAFIEFFGYLVAMMIVTAGMVFFLNARAGRTGLRYPGGIPMMLPISAALMLMAVVG